MKTQRSLEELRQLATQGPRALRDEYPFGFLLRSEGIPGVEPLRDTQGTLRPAASGQNNSQSTRLVPFAEIALEPDDVEPFVLCGIVPPDGAAGRILIGRGRGCDVRLAYPSVSKQHAQFVFSGGKLTGLIDCGSANGTFVNSQRVAQDRPARVKLNDRLRFGVVELRLAPTAEVYGLLGTTE